MRERWSPSIEPGWYCRIEPAVWFGMALFAVLLVLNLVTNPATFAPRNIGPTLGLAAPLILASLAVTPAFLVGNGGIDLSVGPVMGLTNAVLVTRLIEVGVTSPLVVVPTALAVGALVGLVNGLVVAHGRIQPVVTTLATYLTVSGLTIVVAPTAGGTVPNWLSRLATSWSWVVIAGVLLLWWVGVRARPLFDYLMATGGDERAVYTSGIDTARIRVAAYVLSGVFAGAAGLGLTAVLGSVDPTLGPRYTLAGIAAAALGGVSVAGGRGGMTRALVGGAIIFLLQNLLTFVRVSSFLLQVSYGVILVVAISANGALSRSRASTGEAAA